MFRQSKSIKTSSVESLQGRRPCPVFKSQKSGLLQALIAATLLFVSISGGLFSVTVEAKPLTQLDQNLNVGQALDWLMNQQNDDGGFAGVSGESDPSVTCDAVVAMAAGASLGLKSGIDTNLSAAISYLTETSLVYAQSGPASSAKLALAMVAAGEDPTDIGGVNPLSIVGVAAAKGMIGQGPYDHALGLLALAATDSDVPDVAIAAATTSQSADGSWAFDGTTDPGAGDTNTTSLMIQAVIAAGREPNVDLDSAVSYLLSTQGEQGGFPYQPGGESDVNSTSLALQALIAVGNVDNSLSIDMATSFLVSMQNKSGAFRWVAEPTDDNLFATLQAIPAVAGLTLPVMGTLEPEAALATPAT